MEHYMITISSQQKTKFISKANIDSVILWLKMNINSLNICKHVYERSGKYEQLHFHGIVEVLKSFSYKAFTQYGCKEVCDLTFRVQWTKIVDLEGSVQYLLKDLWIESQDQILIQNIYEYHYFNMDSQEFIRA